MIDDQPSRTRVPHFSRPLREVGILTVDGCTNDQRNTVS
jgi:hypothetical protein